MNPRDDMFAPPSDDAEVDQRRMCASCGAAEAEADSRYCWTCEPIHASEADEANSEPDLAIGATGMMTEGEARAAVAGIRSAMRAMRSELAEFHRREGWKALGYKSWDACLASEFDVKSRQHAHYLCKAGEVEADLRAAGVPINQVSALKDSVLVELHALPSEDRAAAWANAQESADKGRVTAGVVRAAVSVQKAGSLHKSPDTSSPAPVAAPEAVHLLKAVRIEAAADDLRFYGRYPGVPGLLCFSVPIASLREILK